jgi:hypothetical protein
MVSLLLLLYVSASTLTYLIVFRRAPVLEESIVNVEVATPDSLQKAA